MRQIINVLWLEPSGQWDQNMIRLLLQNNLNDFDSGFNFQFFDKPPESEGVILVFAGDQNSIETIQSIVDKYKWVLLIKTGDEADNFDWTQIHHPNVKWWIQTPRVERDYGSAKLFGTGFTPHFNQLPAEQPSAENNLFLSAQNTHHRRKEAFQALEKLEGAVLNRTEGFTQGISPEDYTRQTLVSKIIPCPSGVISPDSFRFYEALQAHALPIADEISPYVASNGYWDLLFDTPAPKIKDWSKISEIVDNYSTKWVNRVVVWWINYKRSLVERLTEDLESLSGLERDYISPITVLIPVSPIKSHPSTEIIEETIQSVRHHLPSSEIIIMLDGVRAEQEDRRDDYEEFIKKLLWRADHFYKNISIVFSDEHRHQVGMTHLALEKVRTNLIMFVEQDTPLVDDRFIDFQIIGKVLDLNLLDVVRLHFEAVIPKEHDYLMLSSLDLLGVRFIETIQWSQRPHLTRRDFYAEMLRNNFSPDANSFIEDKMYGAVIEKRNVKIGIYAPNDNLKYDYHTDGRAGEEKYDDRQRF